MADTDDTSSFSRPVLTHYTDPLDALWIATAELCGLKVTRSADTYASSTGDGELIISDDAGLDADDCLAQMIFHELCHSVTMGSESFEWIDWGLDNETTLSDGTGRDDVCEYSCIRMQAALLEPLGLRSVLAPTTDFRDYFDALPADPFEVMPESQWETLEQQRESITRGRAALARRERRPWGPHFMSALEATAAIVHATAPITGKNTLVGLSQPESPHHSVGFPLHPGLSSRAARQGGERHKSPGQRLRCGDCAWSYQVGVSRPVTKCRQADARVERASPACERWEPDFDCLGCGACCREAFDTVEVEAGDPAIHRHLDLMVERSGGYDMARSGSRCVALRGGKDLPAHEPGIYKPNTKELTRDRRSAPHIVPSDEPFTCAIYETRPQTCRKFTLGSEDCLEARRLVGLTR